MPKKIKESKEPLDVKVSWGVKELPERVQKVRASKYAPLLEKVQAKPGRIALLGSFPTNRAVSLVTSLKSAAKKSGTPEAFRFPVRRRVDNMDEYEVYAIFNPDTVEELEEPQAKKRKPRKVKLSNPVTEDSPVETLS